ncbi:MAG: hypothetical protein M1824_001835 [Vezdaea acicularis]|nr:MAG: hypothetical protein M1824_001835 [Vezdaea acicularis]
MRRLSITAVIVPLLLVDPSLAFPVSSTIKLLKNLEARSPWAIGINNMSPIPPNESGDNGAFKSDVNELAKRWTLVEQFDAAVNGLGDSESTTGGSGKRKRWTLLDQFQSAVNDLGDTPTGNMDGDNSISSGKKLRARSPCTNGVTAEGGEFSSVTCSGGICSVCIDGKCHNENENLDIACPETPDDWLRPRMHDGSKPEE